MRREIFCADQLMNRAASSAAEHQQGDPQTLGQDPLADRAVPEVMPPTGERVTPDSVVVVISSITPPDPCFEESVDVPIQYRRRIADLVLGAQILDHLVGVQNVGAHLVAPRAAAVALEGVQLGALFQALAFQELGLKHAHRRHLVLQLRLLVLAGDDDTGRDVGESNRRVGGVDRLTARAAGSVDVDAHIRLGDLDVVGGLDRPAAPRLRRTTSDGGSGCRTG